MNKFVKILWFIAAMQLIILGTYAAAKMLSLFGWWCLTGEVRSW